MMATSERTQKKKRKEKTPGFWHKVLEIKK
jgi:hypothetical protein